MVASLHKVTLGLTLPQAFVAEGRPFALRGRETGQAGALQTTHLLKSNSAPGPHSGASRQRRSAPMANLSCPRAFPPAP